MFALRKTLPAINRNGKALLARKQMKHTLPELPYPCNALEPIICAEIMELHYTKHHAGYVTNLNTALEKLNLALAKDDVNGVVSTLPSIRFNGGGHVNHSIFWTNLAPPSCGGEPSHELKCAIDASFGSLDKMKERMSAMANGIQGSGWAWLGFDPVSKNLQLATCANQDPLQGTTGLIPLLGLDVWEHAYYIQYKNVRPEYVKNYWEIVNWKNVSERFELAKC